MCRFLRLAGLTDAGGSTRSERRTFKPLSISVQAWVPRSLGTSGDLRSITDESTVKLAREEFQKEAYTHMVGVVMGCGGGLVD